MGCSSGSNTTSTTQQANPLAQQAYGQVLGQLQQTANQPYSAYSGPLVSGFTPDQLQAFGTVRNAQGISQPYIDQGASLMQSAAQPLQAMPLSGVQNLAPEAQAVFGNQQHGIDYAVNSGNNATNASQAGASLANQYGGQNNGIVSPFTGYAAGQAGTVSGVAGGLQGSVAPYQGAATQAINLPGYDQLSTYFNPYQQQVTQATQNLFNQQNAQQLAQVRGNAASQNAYGGDREAVAEALTAQQQQLAEAPTLAGIQQQGFSQAQGELNTEQQIEQQRQAAERNLALGAGNLGLGAGTSAGQLGLGAGQLGLGAGQLGLGANTQAAQTALGAGQLGVSGAGTSGQLGLGGAGQNLAAMQGLYGEFNAQNQAQLSAQQGTAWLQQGAGFGLANLGQEAQTQALAGGQAQLGIGGQQQQLAQSQLNIPYQMFQAQQAFPYQTLGYGANIAEGIGSGLGGSASTTTPGPSTLGQLAGLGVAGYGLYNATNGFGGLFGGSGGSGPTDLSGAGTYGGIAGGNPYAARGGRIEHHAGGGTTGLPPSPFSTNLGGAGVPDVSVSYIPEGNPAGGAHGPGAGVGQSVFQPQTTTTTSGGGGGILGDIIGIGKLAAPFLGAAHGGYVPHRAPGGEIVHEVPDLPSLSRAAPASGPAASLASTQPVVNYAPVFDSAGNPSSMGPVPPGFQAPPLIIPSHQGILDRGAYAAQSVKPTLQPDGSFAPQNPTPAPSLAAPPSSTPDMLAMQQQQDLAAALAANGGNSGGWRGGRMTRDSGGGASPPNVSQSYIQVPQQTQHRGVGLPQPPKVSAPPNPLSQITSSMGSLSKMFGDSKSSDTDSGHAAGGLVTLADYGAGYDDGGMVADQSQSQQTQNQNLGQAGYGGYAGGNPLFTQALGQYLQMPIDQLQQLALRPASSPQMQQTQAIAKRALQIKKMNPGQGQQPAFGAPPAPSLGNPQAASTSESSALSPGYGNQMWRGGYARRDEGGGLDPGDLPQDKPFTDPMSGEVMPAPKGGALPSLGLVDAVRKIYGIAPERQMQTLPSRQTNDTTDLGTPMPPAAPPANDDAEIAASPVATIDKPPAPVPNASPADIAQGQLNPTGQTAAPTPAAVAQRPTATERALVAAKPPQDKWLAVGDSIGTGFSRFAGASGKVALDRKDPNYSGADAAAGRSPQEVLTFIGDALKYDPDYFRGKNVLLSSGTSNNPAQIGLVSEQMKALKEAGAAQVKLVGVGNRPGTEGGQQYDLRPYNPMLAKAAGEGNFLGALPAVVHPDTNYYRNTMRGLGNAPAASGDPVVPPDNLTPANIANPPTGNTRNLPSIAAGEPSAGAGLSPGYLSMQQWRDLLIQRGMPPDRAAVGAATIMAESGGNIWARNEKGEHSYGGPQINADAHGPEAKAALGNPVAQADLMMRVSKNGADFNPWTMFRNGTYQRFLGNGDTPSVATGGPDRLGVGTRDAGAQGGGGPNLGTSGAGTPGNDRIGDLIDRLHAERDKSFVANPWMPVVAAGFGMMASRNPHALGAIGEGGLAGIKTAEAQDSSQQKAALSEVRAQSLEQTAQHWLAQAKQAQNALDQKQYFGDQKNLLQTAVAQSQAEARQLHQQAEQLRTAAQAQHLADMQTHYQSIDAAKDEQNRLRKDRDQLLANRYDARFGHADPNNESSALGTWYTPRFVDPNNPDSGKPIFKEGGAPNMSGKESATVNLVNELKKDNPGLTTAQALLTVRDPAGKNSSALNVSIERLAQTAARSETTNDPRLKLEERVQFWRNQYKGALGNNAQMPGLTPTAPQTQPAQQPGAGASPIPAHVTALRAHLGQPDEAQAKAAFDATYGKGTADRILAPQ